MSQLAEFVDDFRMTQRQRPALFYTSKIFSFNQFILFSASDNTDGCQWHNFYSGCHLCLKILLVVVVMAMSGHAVIAVCMSSSVVCQWLGV